MTATASDIITDAKQYLMKVVPYNRQNYRYAKEDRTKKSRVVHTSGLQYVTYRMIALDGIFIR